jgi:hypothetical protein
VLTSGLFVYLNVFNGRQHNNGYNRHTKLQLYRPAVSLKLGGISHIHPLSLETADSATTTAGVYIHHHDGDSQLHVIAIGAHVHHQI